MDEVLQVTILISGEQQRPGVQEAWRRVFPDEADQPALRILNLGLPGRDTLAQVHAIGVLPNN